MWRGSISHNRLAPLPQTCPIFLSQSTTQPFRIPPPSEWHIPPPHKIIKHNLFAHAISTPTPMSTTLASAAPSAWRSTPLGLLPPQHHNRPRSHATTSQNERRHKRQASSRSRKDGHRHLQRRGKKIRRGASVTETIARC